MVALQEMIKSEFRHCDLLVVDPLERFMWQFVLSGGTFFLSGHIRHRASFREWIVLVSYGPAYHSHLPEFLGELQAKVATVATASLPIVVGGHFNLIRSAADKNNMNINWPRVALFNNAIASMALREVARAGARYTWTNKQLATVRSVLDIVFVSSDWEVLFPGCTLIAETRTGSDHIPLILSLGEDGLKRSPQFFFGTAWFEIADFERLFLEKWATAVARLGPQRGPMETWTKAGGRLRAALKGWGANQGREDKLLRASIVAQLAVLDA